MYNISIAAVHVRVDIHYGVKVRDCSRADGEDALSVHAGLPAQHALLETVAVAQCRCSSGKYMHT